jgi:hypothetical protein
MDLNFNYKHNLNKILNLLDYIKQFNSFITFHQMSNEKAHLMVTFYEYF